MICPECKQQNLKSNVYPHGATKTLMYFQSYWDREGIFHIHDRNTVKQMYTCSNGHVWDVKSYDKCPAGDFGGPIDA